MTGYSGTPVIQKLGIQPGFCFIACAPAAYDDIVGKLPADVTIAADVPLADMMHLFATEAAGLAAKTFPASRALLRAGWHDLGLMAEEIFRDCNRPDRCRARHRPCAGSRRHKSLRHRRHLVRIEIRDPERPTHHGRPADQAPEITLRLLASAPSSGVAQSGRCSGKTGIFRCTIHFARRRSGLPA